ncbi:MAG: hypothetical protein LBU74_02525 [Methanobacteriaceae archaeon]|jgi:hypothetical protein|nr:hypothetical protein [Candidatus Methanorudis spinitermitis]
MKNVEKQVVGIFLAVLGAFVIYLSFFHRLIEIFIVFGAILFIIGLYLLSDVFLKNSKANKSKKLKSNDLAPNAKTFSKTSSNKNSKINKKEGEKIVNKVKNVSKSKNPNEMLKKPSSKTKDTGKNFEFTPSYERPVKVRRKPLKKSDLLDISNAPDISKIPKIDKSKEIFEALANDDFIEPEHNTKNKKIPSIKVPESQNQNLNPSKSNSSEINNVSSSQNIAANDNIKSCVLTPNGVVSSKQAYEQLINNAKSEILIETPLIKDINNLLSSKVVDLNVRIIIQEFDIEDSSIMSFAESFIEQGAHIKVLPFVNTTNVIVDEKNALIVSKNKVEEELEVGAVYDDKNEILEIKDTFEKSWELATDFNI